MTFIKSRFVSDLVKFCLISVGVLGAALLGLLWLADELTDGIFPGSQFMYSNNSPRPKEIYLGEHPTIHIWIPRDIIDSIYSGNNGTTAMLDIDLFLPNLISEKQYDAMHPGVESGDDNAVQQQFRDRLTIDLGRADDTSDANGQNEELVEWLNEFLPISRILIDNPYKSYDAYIWSLDNGNTTASEKLDSTDTVYVPHGPISYYIVCSAQLAITAECHLIYIFDNKLRVDVYLPTTNLNQVLSIKDKVTHFLATLKYSQ